MKSIKFNLIILLLVIIQNLGFSQSVFFQWAKQIEGTQYNQGSNISVDKLGNIYIIGGFKGSIDADPGIAVFNLTQTSTAGSTYIVKLDKLGSFVWAKGFDGASSNSAIVDSIGNIFLGGTISVTGADLDPGTSTYTISGSYNQFLLKLNSNGNFVWAKGFYFGSTYDIFDISVNNNGNIMATGQFLGTCDFDPSASIVNLTSAGGKDIFILCLDNLGGFLWVKQIGKITDEKGENIACDKNGNVYITGSFTDQVDFDPGAGIVWQGASGSTKIFPFILKLDINGNYIWSKALINTQASQSVTNEKLTIDKNANIFLSLKYINGIVDVDPGATNYSLNSTAGNSAILKLNSSGAFVWAKQFKDRIGKIKLDRNSNIYVCNQFAFSGGVATDFDPGPGTYTLMASGSGYDAYVLKLNSLGDFSWVKQITGVSGNENATGLCVDSTGNVFVTGDFDNTTDFDPSGSIYNLNCQGSINTFMLKLTNCIYDAPDICLVTVDSLALNNVIYWDKSVYPQADSFLVYRYDAFAMIFRRIGAKSINDPNFLIDTARTVGGPNGGDPQYSSSRYKLAIRGNCGGMGTQGLYHESIFIQQNNQNFSWNAYGIEGQTSPATGYQFMRDNINNGTWQVLVNTGGLSTTDPNYLSYPNGNWRVDALGFSCNPTAKTTQQINKSKSNIKNNFTVTSASELELNTNISLSPNPVKSELLVHFSNHQQTKTEFVITDVLGKVISQTETLESNKIVIPLNDMSNGVYFLKIKQGKLQAVKKFVKE